MGLLGPQGFTAWPAGEHRNSARPMGSVKAEVRLGWEVRTAQPAWSKLGGQMVGQQRQGSQQGHGNPAAWRVGRFPDICPPLPGASGLPIPVQSWGSEERGGVKGREPGGEEVLLRCPLFLRKEANIIPSYLDYQFRLKVH